MKLHDAIDKWCVKEYPVRKWFDNVPKGLSEEKEEINSIVLGHYNNIKEYKCILSKAFELNGYISNQIIEKVTNTVLSEYDQLFTEVLNSEKAWLLWYYMPDTIRDYVEDSLYLEKDNNIDKKIHREGRLLEDCIVGCENLLQYIKEVFPDIIMEG